MAKGKVKPGPYAQDVLALLEKHARAGEGAPSYARIGFEIGKSSSYVQREVNALIDAGLLEVRIDPKVSYRRAYRIVESNLKTAGFDDGLPRYALKETKTQEDVIELLTEIARAGQRAPCGADLALRLGTYAKRVQSLITRAWALRVIEVRSLGGHDRAYRICATGLATAGFDEARVLHHPYGHIDADDDYPVKEEPKPMKARPCLTCQRTFMSEGAHHRMCDSCRGRVEPVTIYSVVAA